MLQSAFGGGGVCSGGVSARGVRVSAPGGGGSAPGGGGGGVCSRGGVCSGGVSLPGGGFSLPGDPPPVNRITDMCKNITLATTSLRPVKIGLRGRREGVPLKWRF